MALTLITFTPGTKIQSSEVNSNFSDINAELFDIDQNNFSGSIAIPDTDLATISTAGKVDGSAVVAQTIDAVKGWFSWALGGELSVGTNVSFEWEATSILTLIGVRLRAKTGPVDADLIFDINKNGVTIFSTRPQITDGATSEAGTEVFSVTGLVDGDYLTLDVDQVGSTTPGSNVSVQLLAEQKVPQ